MRSRYRVRFQRPGFLARAFDSLDEALEHCRRIRQDADGHAEITPSITLTVYDTRNGRPVAIVAAFPEHWTPAMVQVMKDRLE